MKIAIIVSLFPPKWLGGTEIATYNQAKYFAIKGHDVHIITRLDDDFSQEVIVDGFFLWRVKIVPIRIIGSLVFYFKILILLKKIKPDIIHAQGIAMGLPAMFAKIFLNIPYIVYSRCSPILVYNGTIIEHLKSINIFIQKLILKRAKTIIVLTEDMKNEIKAIYKDCNVVILPNGIDISKYNKRKKPNQNHIISNKRILWIGRFRPEKGVNFLIEAMSLIIKEIDASLILVGYGNEEKSLIDLTHKHNLDRTVQFEGKVKNEDIIDYLITSDLFVLPSITEGFPMVILEAMACGLPIVASNINGISEIITDGENGLLARPKNPEDIARKVILLLKNDKLRAEFSKNNLEKIHQYKLETTGDSLLKIFSE